LIFSEFSPFSAASGVRELISVSEIRLFFPDPFDKFFHFGMVAQPFEGMVKVKKFAFCKNRMDLGMANDMQRHRFRAFVGFGLEMMHVDGFAFNQVPSTDAAFGDDFEC
jgi:hypothetical protein